MKRANGTIVMAMAVALLAGAWTASVAQDATTGKTGELVARVKFTKQQFQDVTAKMIEVADLLAESEPETAQVLRETVSQARRAFIAEDMDKVAEHLARGAAAMAADTETQIVEELKKVLDTLLHGTMDLETRMKRIREWKEALEKLNELIEKQEALERTSRLTNNAQQLDAKMQELAGKLSDVVAEQKKLLAETEKLPQGDPAVQKLAALRDKVGALVAEQQAVNSATKSAPVDKLPVAAEAQKALNEKTKQVAKELAEAASDAAMSKALSESGADSKAASKAGKSLSAASKEMGKATKALNESDAAKANNPQKQAEADLKAAHKALSEALSKAAAQTPGARCLRSRRSWPRRRPTSPSR